MSEPPPGLVLMTYSTGRVGGLPAIGPGLKAAAGDAAAAGAAAAGEAAAAGAPGAAAGDAAGAAAGGAAGAVVAAAAGGDVGFGASAGFWGVGGDAGAQATINRDVATPAARFRQITVRFIATQDLHRSRLLAGRTSRWWARLGPTCPP